ncbi:MAG: serine protease, partial [Spirochaetota bacterium]
NITSEEKHQGNGEVIISENKVVGILYQFRSSKNTGKVIPGFIINTFLQSPPEKTDSSFSHSGIVYRPLLDDVTKGFYGLSRKENGVIVANIIPYSSAEGKIQVNDVILSFAGFPIDSKGYFTHKLYEKQSLAFLANCGHNLGFRQGKSITVELLRNKKRKKVSFVLKPFPYKAIKIPYKNNMGKPPYYMIKGGFVFIELSKFLLKEWGLRWRSKINKKLLYLHDFHKLHNAKEKGHYVILSQVFPNRANNGYHNISMRIIQSVNGKKIHSIQELAEEIDTSSQEYITITLDDGIEVVLVKKDLPTIDRLIRKKFQIRKLQNFKIKGRQAWYHPNNYSSVLKK